LVYDLIVIGGGPAGIMGAAAAGGKGLQVLLVEKNSELGRKLSITGGGRCNLTNIGSMDIFQNNIVTNSKFLYSSLTSFSNLKLIEIINEYGVKTKIEEDSRVFPASDKSSDIVNALLRYLHTSSVEVLLSEKVEHVLVRANSVHGVMLRGGRQIKGKNVLIATGGLSYGHTGSTGDGLMMAQKLGHTVVQPRPGLVPLVTVEEWPGRLQGLTLEAVKVRAIVGGRAEAEQTGDVLFTHFGVSGPAILNISSCIHAFELPVSLCMDLLPFLSIDELEKRLQENFKRNQGKLLKNALGEYISQRMAPVILERSELSTDLQVDRVTRREREKLARTMKNLIVNIVGPRPLKEAIVTRGGIDVKEINPSTLESKLIDGLYFAGEVMDVDALTGGYNLQVAFSTGYLSGISAACRLRRS